MPILIVAATVFESQILSELSHASINVLNTGVGMLNAAHHVTKILNQRKYDLVLNIGICGSYRRRFAIGDVVHIDEEVLSDLGATDAGGEFLDLKVMGFKLFEKNGTTYFNSIKNPNSLTDFFAFDFSNLASVRSASVNTVHGCENDITAITKQFDPDVENMEGAAVSYVCLQEDIPYFEFRAISNYVEPRDKTNWNTTLAARKVQEFVLNLIPQTKINF